MKKFIFTCMAFLAAGFASAQETSTETYIDDIVVDDEPAGNFWKNWFFTLEGGPSIYFGDHDRQCKVGSRIAPMGSFSIGKNVNPVVGIRVSYTTAGQRGATKWGNGGEDTGFGPTGVDVPGKGHDNIAYFLQKQKFSFGNASAVVMVNMTNLLRGHKQMHHFYCIPYLGVGFAHVYNPSGEMQASALRDQNGKGREASANIGVFNLIPLTKRIDLNFNLNGVYFNDRFDAEGGGRFGEGDWSLMVGLTYKFSRKGFAQDHIITKTVLQRDEAVRKMNELMAENERMHKELEARSQQPTVKREVREVTHEVQRLVAAPNLIVFEINKSHLSNEARVNLGMFAELIKACDPSAVYTISGYADKGTGSIERNARLSQDRAQAVYDCLTKEFGVNPDQLKIVANGGVDNMFYDDPRLSRAVINRVETK